MATPEYLNTSVIRDLRTLEQMSSEWTDLWNRCPGATSFQRPEWVLSWTQAFLPKDLVVIAVRRGKLLVGIAPLFLYQSGHEQVLAPLAASVSDYIDWLIEPGSESEILRQIRAVLDNLGVPWDRLDLTDLPRSSPLLRFDFDDWDCERSGETVCPVLSLPGVNSVEEILSAKPRHNLRTARRRTEKAGKAEIELASEETLDELLAAMMRLHGARWTACGVPGVLAGEQVQDFHRRAAPMLLKRGVLRLYGLRLNGKLIATLYALSERETVYCYLQGFDPAYSTLSPGAQILAAVIDDCLREGKKVVDFLRGHEQYKYLWGARDQQTYRLCLRHRTPVQRFPPPVAA